MVQLPFHAHIDKFQFHIICIANHIDPASPNMGVAEQQLPCKFLWRCSDPFFIHPVVCPEKEKPFFAYGRVLPASDPCILDGDVFQQAKAAGGFGQVLLPFPGSRFRAMRPYPVFFLFFPYMDWTV